MAFQIALGWGLAPSEFWAMSPQEWFWIYDRRRADRDHVRLRYDPALLRMIGEE